MYLKGSRRKVKMLIDTKRLPKDERTYLELGALYEGAGYSLYKMRRFEEYSLYLDNRNFLGSDAVLTFQGPGGKLMALKPDVTLSIAKNARLEGDKPVKVYYRESVYRAEKDDAEFKEINQMGLEYMGKDGGETASVCELALKSLATIDETFIFALSHMGFVSAVIESAGVLPSRVKAVLECIRSRNVHDLALAGNLSGEVAERLASLIKGSMDFKEALARARLVATTKAANSALDEMQSIYDRLFVTKYEKNIRLDLSILNDVDYYNGVVFQGFVGRVPRVVLSGGRYDGLLTKRGTGLVAMGFALNLGELNAFYPTGEEIKK